MSLARRAKRRDRNEAAIVRALRKAGCLVKQSDFVDLVVNRGGHVFLLEVKADGGRLTESQLAMLKDGWPLFVVRDEEAALKAVGLGSAVGEPEEAA